MYCQHIWVHEKSFKENKFRYLGFWKCKLHLRDDIHFNANYFFFPRWNFTERYIFSSAILPGINILIEIFIRRFEYHLVKFSRSHWVWFDITLHIISGVTSQIRRLWTSSNFFSWLNSLVELAPIFFFFLFENPMMNIKIDLNNIWIKMDVIMFYMLFL